MAQEFLDTISRFDQVSLITTKNVTYVSTESPEMPTSGGAWTVVALIGTDLILTKDMTVIRLPSKDVLKIADYDKSMKQVFSFLGDLLGHGKRKEDSNTKQ
jgi:hypothetical protein